jgi:hypothetical protein
VEEFVAQLFVDLIPYCTRLLSQLLTRHVILNLRLGFGSLLHGGHHALRPILLLHLVHDEGVRGPPEAHVELSLTASLARQVLDDLLLVHLLIDLLNGRSNLAVELLHQHINMLKGLSCGLLLPAVETSWCAVVPVVLVVPWVLVERGVLDLQLLCCKAIAVLLLRRRGCRHRTSTVERRSGLRLRMLSTNSHCVRWEGTGGDGARSLLLQHRGRASLVLA